MKNRKILSVLLALVLVFSLSLTAFAAPGKVHTITITNKEAQHKYEAYQVFSGTVEVVDNEKRIRDIAWGEGVNAAKLLEALKKDSTAVAETKTLGEFFADCTNAAQVAEVLGQNMDNAALAKAFAKVAGANLTSKKTTSGAETKIAGKTEDEDYYEYKISGLTDGYYLVKDANNSLGTNYDAYTDYILQVIEDVSVAAKSSVPEVTKQVVDKNDSTGTSTTNDDSADYDMGDAVEFILTGTLPENYDSYKTYKYIFHDTLSAGLTYNNDAKVFVGETDVTAYFTITHNNGELTVACNDLKAIENLKYGDSIVVKYTATLNENAVVGGKGNENTVYLEYSNNPNADGEGTTGNTPENTVIVFTYKLIIDKVDENNNALAGAKFMLQKYSAETKKYEDYITEPVVTENGTEFEFNGLDDGMYQLVEVEAPEGYNKAPNPFKFEVSATDDGKKIITIEGKGDAIDLTSYRGDPSNGTLIGEIENNKGPQLPTTGGIGTTIFYVVGAVLVLAAGIILISKRRMKAAA